jgi:hypothetical protein
MDSSLKIKWYYAIFKNGKYLDLWSVNHTLAGVVIAGPLYYFSIPLVYSLAISLFLIVGWEVYEILFEIHETWQNRSTDIIVGVLGFFFIWYLYPHITTAQQLEIYAISFFVFIVLEIWGFIAYKAKVR